MSSETKIWIVLLIHMIIILIMAMVICKLMDDVEKLKKDKNV